MTSPSPKITCKQCKAENNADSVFCTNCGGELAQPRASDQIPKKDDFGTLASDTSSTTTTCPYCAEAVQVNAIKCKHCGEVLKKNDYRKQKIDWNPDYDRSGISNYYLKKFDAFDAGHGRFAANWNWYALFFGIFWYFYKGMWGKGLIMAIAAGAFAGVPAIVFWGYCAVAGNYDYYLLKTRGKQLW